MILDILLFAIVAVVTWCVASEGAWGAALTMVSVLLAGILATNFFEVAANFLEANVAGSYEWQHRWDVIAMVGLFSGFVLAFRKVTERIMPVHLEVQGMVYDVARWALSAAAGCVTMAFLLTALHTALLPPGFLGFTSEPERRVGPLGRAAPDLRWLGFVHYLTETAFNQGGGGPIFDGARFRYYAEQLPGEFEVLPSFPIRYASRRDRYFGAAPATATTSATASPGRAPGGPDKTAGPARF